MKKMNRKLSLVVLSAVVAGFASIVCADIPRLISYQGKLTNASGAALDGAYSFVFTMYDASGTTPKWTETHPTVQVSGGLYTVILGTKTAGGIQSVSFTEPIMLGITVNGEPLDPMQLITASPYSLNPSTATGETTMDFFCRQSTGALRTDITAIQQSTGTLKNQVTSIGTSTATLRADVTALQQSDVTLLSRFTSVGVSTATLRADLASVQAQTSTVGDSTATLRTDVTALQQSNVTHLSRFSSVGVSTATLRADLASVQAQTSTVGDSTATLRTDVTALQQSTGTLLNRFAAVGASTATLSGQFASVGSSTGTLRTDLNAGFNAVSVSTTTLRTDLDAHSRIKFGSNANINDLGLPAGTMFYNNDDQLIYIATETTQNSASWRKVSTAP